MAFGFLGKLFSVETYVQGYEKVKRRLHDFEEAIHEVVGTGKLEKLLVERIKARFQPPGTHEMAQRGPDGTPWKELAPSTKRKVNKNKRQKLVDTGNLRDSIMVVRSNLRGAFTLGEGKSFDIGVNPASPARKYARLHQEGGSSGRGAIVPARPYLGFNATDAREVDDLLGIVLRKHGFTVRG